MSPKIRIGVCLLRNPFSNDSSYDECWRKTDKLGGGIAQQCGSKGGKTLCHMMVDVQTPVKIVFLIASLMPGCNVVAFCSAELAGV